MAVISTKYNVLCQGKPLTNVFPRRPATVISIHFHDGWSKKSHAKIWHPCSDQRIPLFPAIVRHIWYRPKAHKALRESGLVLILVIMRSFFWIGTTYYRNYLTETHGWIWGTCLAMTCVASFIEVNYVASSICVWYFLMDKIALRGITFMIPWIPAVWTSWISDIHCCFEHSWCFLIGRDCDLVETRYSPYA